MPRTLSHAEIVNCENAKESRCRCRCRGLLHGAKRVSVDSGVEGFYALPVDDPHHLPSPSERKATARTKRAEQRAARNRMMREQIWQRIEQRREVVR
jgi:hypothetical protein